MSASSHGLVPHTAVRAVPGACLVLKGCAQLRPQSFAVSFEGACKKVGSRRAIRPDIVLVAGSQRRLIAARVPLHATRTERGPSCSAREAATLDAADLTRLLCRRHTKLSSHGLPAGRTQVRVEARYRRRSFGPSPSSSARTRARLEPKNASTRRLSFDRQGRETSAAKLSGRRGPHPEPTTNPRKVRVLRASTRSLYQRRTPQHRSSYRHSKG